MKYDLNIRDYNVPAHIDIEEEVNKRQHGLLTFTIRVNNGNIVDLNITDYVNAQQKYGIVRGVLIEKYTITHDNSQRSASDSIRTDNGNSTAIKRGSEGGNTQHSKEQT